MKKNTRIANEWHHVAVGLLIISVFLTYFRYFLNISKVFPIYFSNISDISQIFQILFKYFRYYWYFANISGSSEVFPIFLKYFRYFSNISHISDIFSRMYTPISEGKSPLEFSHSGVTSLHPVEKGPCVSPILLL